MASLTPAPNITVGGSSDLRRTDEMLSAHSYRFPQLFPDQNFVQWFTISKKMECLEQMI